MGSLPVARLQAIERDAAAARAVAAERMQDYGMPLGPDADMRVVAGLLTGGTADPVENLEEGGDRLAGHLVWQPTAVSIRFEAYDPPVRQRFSIAHELGHYFLHVVGFPNTFRRCPARSVDPEDEGASESGVDEGTERESDTASSAPATDVEAEADAWAGAFLVPGPDLEEAAGRFGKCDAFLAHYFHVSEATLRRRARTLSCIRAEAAAGSPGQAAAQAAGPVTEARP